MHAPLIRFGRLDWPGRGLPSLFDEVFDSVPWFGSSSLVSTGEFPALNVWDTGDALHMEAEVPGYALDDLELALNGRELTIEGERKDDIEDGEGASHLRRERRMGAFRRVLRLPFDVDAEAVQATGQNGVLTIVLPKTGAHQPRKITVNASSAD